MSDLLKLLWETYKDTPFSQNAIAKDLSINWENQQQIIHQLNALKNQPAQNGLKIKSVGSGIFKVIRAQASEVDPIKDLPLPPVKETLVGDLEHFSFFQRGDQSQNPQHTGNVHQLHDKLTSSPAWEAKIAEILRLSHDPEAQSTAKVKLPAFTPSIMLHTGVMRRAVKNGDFTHTHLIQADFDHSPDFDTLFDELKADPHARLVFRSPRGNVKALIRVQPVNTVEEHRSAFQAVADYCLGQGYGEIDSKPKNIAALCFISYDPHAVLKDAAPLAWELLPEQPTPPSERPDVPIEHQTTLTEWLEKHNIPIHDTRLGPTQSGRNALMLLIDCPWENQHTTDFGHKDTAVFEDPVTGKWSFNCFHAHCDGRSWEDFREKVAPKPSEQRNASPAMRMAYDINRKARYGN